jgi:regulator of cell morphogenesis and NO signaling
MTSEVTLADLVTRHPGSARVLERHRLDYCCGGRRSLADACAEAGIDPTSVLAELEQTPPSPTPDWAAMGPAELVDHLEATHHRYLWEELPRLDTLAAKVRAAHGTRHPELASVATTLATLRADLEPHLTKEERILFPMIRELGQADAPPSFQCGTLANPIRVMLAEHDRAGELLAELRALTDDHRPPADGCASYRALYEGLAELEADTHLHVHKENNLLFPAVLAREAELAAR